MGGIVMGSTAVVKRYFSIGTGAGQRSELGKSVFEKGQQNWITAV